MRRTCADIREERLDQTLRTFAGEGNWPAVLRTLDAFDANSDRRERLHRADIDTTITDRDPGEGEYCRSADLLRLSCREDWEELIFTRRWEDLYQLAQASDLSAALRALTPIQKRVLFQNVVLGIPAKEIARAMGCSDRNVTKHRMTALRKIRGLVMGEA